MAITLRFIWYHKVLGKQQTNIIPKKEPLYKVDEVALANVDDDKGVTRDGPEPDIETNKVSKLCGKYRGGTCLCKVKHTWNECLRKKIGINHRNYINNKGDIILCTLCKSQEKMVNVDDQELNDSVYAMECVEDDGNDRENQTIDNVY